MTESTFDRRAGHVAQPRPLAVADSLGRPAASASPAGAFSTGGERPTTPTMTKTPTPT